MSGASTAHHVVRLPCLVAGSARWYLPLSDDAALQLARVSLSDEVATRETLIAQLMSIDPAVTLWSACMAASGRGGSSAGSSPRCVMALAQWLARHAARFLHWSPEELAEAAGRTDHRKRWGELAGDAVAVASLAADPIADDVLAAEVFLMGLLHNAADWLRLCGPRVSLAKEQTGCLPAWLVARLRQRSRGPRGEVMRHVVEAARVWRDAGRRGRQVRGVDVSEALVARRRWHPRGPAPRHEGHLLACLLEKLRRLNHLEQEFDRAVEHEKLASLGELAYGASHEINNPLANISTRAQALLADEADPERRRMLATINTQALRANEMVADMMLFARPPALDCHDVDLVGLADQLVKELADEAALQGTELTCSGWRGPLLVSADATQLAQAVRAVMVNALQALGADGQVDVVLERDEPGLHDGQPWGRIAVRDTGPGIAAEVRRHLFDPFFSGREAGRGLGLGLAKCWRVVALHHGRIDVTTAARQGTTISISLPLVAGGDANE